MLNTTTDVTSPHFHACSMYCNTLTRITLWRHCNDALARSEEHKKPFSFWLPRCSFHINYDGPPVDTTQPVAPRGSARHISKSSSDNQAAETAKVTTLIQALLSEYSPAIAIMERPPNDPQRLPVPPFMPPRGPNEAFLDGSMAYPYNEQFQGPPGHHDQRMNPNMRANVDDWPGRCGLGHPRMGPPQGEYCSFVGTIVVLGH
jgi:hypothetical protein